MTRLAAALVILGSLTALAVLVDTRASTAIVFSFVGHIAVAAGVGLYAFDRLRPVKMTSDERMLYKLAFGDLAPRSFVEFAALGEWRDASSGERLFSRGDDLTEIPILVSGSVSALVAGEPVGTLGPGQLVGAAAMLTGDNAWLDAVVEEPCRYLAIPIAAAALALEKKPETRAAINNIVSRDLAGKIQALTGASAS